MSSPLMIALRSFQQKAGELSALVCEIEAIHHGQKAAYFAAVDAGTGIAEATQEWLSIEPRYRKLVADYSAGAYDLEAMRAQIKSLLDVALNSPWVAVGWRYFLQ